MARSRFNDPIEPMDLANMRENGVRSLWVQCNQCRHTTVMNVDHLSPTISPCIRAADGVHVGQSALTRAGGEPISGFLVLQPPIPSAVFLSDAF